MVIRGDVLIWGRLFQHFFNHNIICTNIIIHKNITVLGGYLFPVHCYITSIRLSYYLFFQAEEFVRANVCSKLTLIAEQVRALHRQALDIVNEARRSNELHRAGCNFAKIPGQVYYLYQRPSGQKYFSLLSMNVSRLNKGMDGESE